MKASAADEVSELCGIALKIQKGVFPKQGKRPLPFQPAANPQGLKLE